MPFSEIDILPDPPQRDGDPDTFADLADTFVVAMQTFTEQINVFKTELEAAAALINAAPAYADAMLLALADGNTPAADKLPYLTGATSSAVTDFTGVARTLLAQSTQGAMRETGLGMSANGSSLVSAADYSAMRTLLGLVIGTDVQAHDAELAAIAGLTSAADKGIQFTGSGAAATFDLTAFAKTLLDDANAAAALTTLGAQPALATGSNANGYWISITIGATTFYYQWGRITAAANGTSTITFPQAFTTSASISVTGSGVDAGGGTSAQDNPPGISAYSTTTASVFSADDTSCTFHWQAMGY